MVAASTPSIVVMWHWRVLCVTAVLPTRCGCWSPRLILISKVVCLRTMARLARAEEEGVVASDFEFHLPRPSYTINTLGALEAAFPGREFLLLMGADNWAKMDKWYRGAEIVSRYGIIVYPRGGEPVSMLPANVKWLQAPLYDISSTEIRHALSLGENVSQWLHPNVIKYINKKKLYI